MYFGISKYPSFVNGKDIELYNFATITISQFILHTRLLYRISNNKQLFQLLVTNNSQTHDPSARM